MEKLQHPLVKTFCLGIGTVWIAYQVWILLSPLPPITQRSFHLLPALALALLAYPLATSAFSCWLRCFIDGLLLAGVGALIVYYGLAAERLSLRMQGVDPVPSIDLTAALLLLAILLECVRRVIGWSLLGVILIFLAFGFSGQWIPGWTDLRWLPELFKFSGFTFAAAAEHFALTPNGALGVTTATSVNFVFYFVLFGAVYSAIGGGQLFIDIGLRVAGRRQGGAAKAAVLASSLMGSVSGSAVANVATTGIFTIPLMRRAGCSRVYAGAVEAIASTGGQLMPPIMGVAAFVMAELVQEPYGKIALAGLIPAVAFYLALLLAVDLRARRTGVGNVVTSDEPPAPSICRRLHLLVPPIGLLVFLVLGWSASLAAVGAVILCIIMAVLLPSLRLNWRQWQEVVLRGGRQAAEVAVPIAAIGLIIEVAVQSNLALKFTLLLLDLGGTTVLGAMVLVVFGCVIMGLGLPTVAAYIIGAILFVPALRDLGLPELSAHFFVMYYCVLSMVTPPVALASYTAAGLAGSSSFHTSLTAFKLGLVGFFIPFAFAFNPALLAQDSWWIIIGSTVILFLGTSAWVLGLEGYFTRSLSVGERWSIAFAGLALLIAPITIDAVVLNTNLDLWTARCILWSVPLLMMAVIVVKIISSTKRDASED